jgi:hypothetical protein
MATGISGQSGGITHNGKVTIASSSIPASATIPFQTLPAMPPPRRRASPGKRREATCSTISAMPNTLRMIRAVR